MYVQLPLEFIEIHVKLCGNRRLRGISGILRFFYTLLPRMKYSQLFIATINGEEEEEVEDAAKTLP